jgi:peptide/nickel transport system substrate-binding protein
MSLRWRCRRAFCFVALLVFISFGGIATAVEGELRVAYPQRVVNLDPHGSAAAERIVITLSRHLFDRLVEWDAAAGEFRPQLATGWESPDDTTWQFQLREGVRFHDGNELTSEDVAASLERVVDLAGPLSALWQLIEEVETPDPYTVIIRTSEPMGTLLSNLTMLAIAPAWALEADDFEERPVGSGPFRFEEWIRDERVVLVANEDYWREGLPQVERLVWVDIPEVSARMTALTRGEIDLTVQIPPEQRPALEAQEDITVVDGPTFRSRFIWLNPEREPLDNRMVRQAIWHALDIDAMVETILEGVAARATAAVASTVFGYAEMPPYEYSPERALELLEEAGYPQGFDIELKWNPDDVKEQEVAETVVAQLAAIGINVSSVQQPRAIWVEDLLALDWDMNLLGTGALTGDADYLLGRLYHSRAQRTGYESPELDGLLDAAATTLDPEERLEYYRQAQELLWEEAVTIFLFEAVETYAYRDNVEGFEVPQDQLPVLSEVSVQR